MEEWIWSVGFVSATWLVLRASRSHKRNAARRGALKADRQVVRQTVQDMINAMRIESGSATSLPLLYQYHRTLQGQLSAYWNPLSFAEFLDELQQDMDLLGYRGFKSRYGVKVTFEDHLSLKSSVKQLVEFAMYLGCPQTASLNQHRSTSDEARLLRPVATSGSSLVKRTSDGAAWMGVLVSAVNAIVNLVK